MKFTAPMARALLAVGVMLGSALRMGGWWVPPLFCALLIWGAPPLLRAARRRGWIP